MLGSDADVPTESQLGQLTYTTQVLQETLRFCPPAGNISRITHEDVQINGYTVPANTYVVVNVHGLHRHPDYWKVRGFRCYHVLWV